MKHNFKLMRLWVASLLLLFGISPNAWAEKGFWDEGTFNVQMYVNGTSNWLYGTSSNRTNVDEKDLGYVTSLNFGGYWIKTWATDNWDRDKVNLYAAVDDESSFTGWYEVSGKNYEEYKVENTNLDKGLISNYSVGEHVIKYYFALDDYRYASNQSDQNSIGSTYYKIKYTIPGFTKANASQTDYEVAVGSNQSKTISFTQHYGTQLTTKNCKITGTNGNEFSVTSISETGVTVKFAPSSAGPKSATLTITDAHSKICTISLSGIANAVYTVTYAASDKTSGSVPTDANQYAQGANVTVLGNTGNLGKTGYTFASWKHSINSNTYMAGQTFAMGTADVTMTAQWTANTNTPYIVKHYKQNLDGTYPAEPFAIDNLTGTTGASVTPDVKTGSDITGFTAPDTQTKTIAADGSLVVTYNYTRNSHTLTWDADGGTITGDYTSGSVKYGATITAPANANVTKDGFNFNGWHNGTAIVTPATTMPDNDLTYTAQWLNAATYTLTVNKTEGITEVTGGLEDQPSVPFNSTISATLAEKGYTFTGWTADPAANASFGNKNDLSTTVTVNNGSVTVTANAVAKTYTLTLNGNGGHVQNTEPEQTSADVTVTYNEGCPAIPTFVRTGYTYSGFAVSTAQSAAKIILQANTFTTSKTSPASNWVTDAKWTKDEDGTLYAVWTAHYKTVTLNKHYTQSATAGSGSDGTGKITVGTKMAENYTAATRTGHTLLGYSIEENGTTMVMDKDGNFIASVDGYTDAEGNWVQDITDGTIEKLYAQWQEVKTTVALSANPVGSGTIKISGANATEAAVGITTRPAVSATPLNADWTFASWTPTNCSVVDGKLVGDGTSETGSLVANFTLTECNLVYSKWIHFQIEDGTIPMQYSTSEKAYYVDVVTAFGPDDTEGEKGYYFRFKIGDSQWSADWENASETKVKSLNVGDAKLTCDKDVHEWKTWSSIKFPGAKGSTIRIWFDQVNKKTWITEPTHTVTILGSEYGTITPTGARQVGQLQGLAISATVSNDSYGFYFSGWTADKAGITFADASAKSTTVYASEDGTVTPNYASRYALRGSLATSDDPHGMPGWDDDTQTFNFVKGQRTATYQATLERYQNYKLKVKDLEKNTSYGASGTIAENGSIKLGSNDAAPTFTTTIAGTYTFTLDVNSGGTTPTISIAYPASVTATYSISATDVAAAANAPTAVSETVTIESGTRVTKDNSITFTAQPAKTGYTFSGWFDNAAGTGTALTTELAYTTTASEDITIYAVYAETMSTITINTPLSTQGSIDVIGEKSLGITTSQQIVATAVTGYYFKEWQVSGSALVTDAHSATTNVYTNGSGEIGNVTAVFEFRWVLRGSRVDDSGNEGMPGWETTTDYFVFAEGQEVGKEVGTIEVSLLPNRQYKFMVYDKKLGKQCGLDAVTALAASTWSNLLSGTYHLTMWSAGHGVYTFKVQENADHSKAKVYISNAASECITMGTKSVTEGCGTELDGGTITAKDDENYTITTGQYVRNGGAVTFTATPKIGYIFSGFYIDAECNTKLSDENPYTISDIKSNKSVYAKFTEKLYNVTYNNGETTTTIQAGIASHPEITAQHIDGRKFTGWETYGVSVANSTAKTTTISYVDMGVNDHRVTATYGDLDVIYFNNQISGTWDPTEMYVYFYKAAYPYFDNSGAGSSYNGGGSWDPTCMMKKGIPMTKIEGTTIWKAEYDKEDSEYFAYSSEDIKMVAFNDHRQDNTARFTGCSVVYVDFNSCMNMYVQDKTEGFGKQYEQNPQAWYRNNGFWKNYDAANSGLYLKIANVTSGDGQAFDTKEGPDSYSTSLHLNTESAGASTYDFYLYISSCNGSHYSKESGQIYSDNPAIDLLKWNNEPGSDKKVTLHATATGSYKFIITHNNDNTLTLRVEYPVCVGDFRVVSVIGGKAHDNGYIYRSSATEDEKASFYVTNDATVKLQKCTAISGANVTWTDVQSISISGLDNPGYYNYTITHDGANASIAAAGKYEGNFYLRTDVAPGGWSNYLTNAGNIIQENEYGMNEAQTFKFTHAYTNHVGHGGNVKFVIANDYSKCISDTLVKDDFITDNAGNLPSGKDANVRFMWNKNTNETKRAYIGGSALTTDRYLVLLGNTTTINEEIKHLMVDANGVAFPEGGTGRDGLHADEAIFTDLGNWIYQVNIKAFSGAAVKLMADFAGKTQYFVGAEGNETGSWRTIMAGSETKNPYTIQVVYDFKSNRLVAGFVPDGQEISSDIVLNGDLLLLREMQEDAKQIKFGEAAQGQNPYSISQIDHIYCGLQINKGHAGQNDGMIGSTNNDYAKTMYWISFPFDVNINEIFGLDGYGQKWIIQKYNGAERASKGWFKGDGTKTFWEFMDYNETMKAYEGYLFLLDANYFNETNDKVWEIGTVDHITFYFPSASGNIGIINKSEYTQEVPAHKCDIKREFNIGTEQDPIMVSHEQTDSYWNVIGVPAFQNKSMALSTTEVDTKMKAIYQWNSTYNTYDVVALQNNFEFKTMYAYMVQFGGDITWSDVSVVNNPTEAQGGPAPKYAYADEKNYMIELFFNGNDAEDHTYINLADEASTDFVLNEDMMKIDNAGFPNIYSFAGNYNVAYNETKKDNQTVMLGVSAPKDGNYTFAMPKDFSGTAKLVDLVEGITTDLNVANYSVDLNKGTYNNRFQLVLEVEAKTPTSIENVDCGWWMEDGKTQKLLRNGNIYLINGGRVYNATGAELQ